MSFNRPLCWRYSGLVTPERLCTSEFLELLDAVYENHNLNRLVVDEVGFSWSFKHTLPHEFYQAHCISVSRDENFFFVLASIHLFLGMGSRFSRRISTYWEIPRALSRCSNHGSHCDCHSGVSCWFLNSFLLNQPLVCRRTSSRVWSSTKLIFLWPCIHSTVKIYFMRYGLRITYQVRTWHWALKGQVSVQSWTTKPDGGHIWVYHNIVQATGTSLLGNRLLPSSKDMRRFSFISSRKRPKCKAIPSWRPVRPFLWNSSRAYIQIALRRLRRRCKVGLPVLLVNLVVESI